MSKATKKAAPVKAKRTVTKKKTAAKAAKPAPVAPAPTAPVHTEVEGIHTVNAGRGVVIAYLPKGMTGATLAGVAERFKETGGKPRNRKRTVIITEHAPKAEAKKGPRKASAPRAAGAAGKCAEIIALHVAGKTNKEIIELGYNKSTVGRQVSEYKKSLTIKTESNVTTA